MRRIALFAMVLGLVSNVASAQNARFFDGNWIVTMVCEPVVDGVPGYSLSFWAQVANGMLRGLYGIEGRPPWLRLEGPIAPNGVAMLIAQGQSGVLDYAVGRARGASPLTYHIEARLAGSGGSGRRLDSRPCNLSFVRQ